MNKDTERRSNYPLPEEEMYKLPNIKEFIEKERRHDELDRLRDAMEQKKVWKRTLIFCLMLNATLLTLAYLGMGK